MNSKRMNSIIYKLAAVFIAISLIPLLIGVTGTLTLRTAGGTLTETNNALGQLSQLLASADQSLTKNVELQERANQVIAAISAGQQNASESLQNMADVMLPRSFAVARIRLAINDVAQAERALLLAMNMRHLVGEELQQAKEEQYENITNALEGLDEARADYLKRIRPGEDKAAWEAFEASLTAWRRNHALFMTKIDELNVLVEDLIRGGPLFATASREAYNTLFREGRNIRRESEQRLFDLNRDIVDTADASVRVVVDSQSTNRDRIASLTAEAGAVSGNVLDLQAEFGKARRAADAAAVSSAEALTGTGQRFWSMALLSVIGFALAMAAGLVLSRRISLPVRDMVTHMSRLAVGDLSVDVPEAVCRRTDEIGQLARGLQDVVTSNREQIRLANAMAAGDYTQHMTIRSDDDQLGRALSQMMRVTNDTLAMVSRTIDQVGDGAAAVSEASRSLSLGAQTSASAVEEISQTVNHVDRQARDNAAHALEANKLATVSRDAARRGYATVTELVDAMKEIQQAGAKIATVAKLIDDIAFQTNLLALNAAVEAARAGRQGRGFSVVADEVRNLSGRSARAARETSGMISAMTERMEAGVQMATRTDQEFRDIVEATEKVEAIFTDIASASDAQSQATAQISQGLSQIDQVIQENTTNAGSTANSSLTLSRQAEELRRMVGRFRLLNVSFDRDGKLTIHRRKRDMLPGSGGRLRLPGPPDDGEDE